MFSRKATKTELNQDDVKDFEQIQSEIEEELERQQQFTSENQQVFNINQHNQHTSIETRIGYTEQQRRK
ncbi:hypothetical protein ABK040_010001 [Willaertia magna]